MAETDRTTFAPFVLSRGSRPSLLLCQGMEQRAATFEAEGWTGNGYDWAAVAAVLAGESAVTFDPEADMLAAHGPLAELERLAEGLRHAFDDEAALRALIRRATRD